MLFLQKNASYGLFFWCVEGESQDHYSALMDMSFHSLAQEGDAFGDEGKGFDLLGSYWKSVCFGHCFFSFHLKKHL